MHTLHSRAEFLLLLYQKFEEKKIKFEPVLLELCLFTSKPRVNCGL